MEHQRNQSSRIFLRAVMTALLLSAGGLGVAVPASATATTFEGRMLELINAARASAGVAPVQASAALAGVAGSAPYSGCGFPVAGRSSDMGARNYFSHTILDCGTKGAAEMVAAAGVTVKPAENIAWVSGFTDPVAAAERLHNDLMSSPQHRDNILNPANTQVGVGSWRTATGAEWSGGGSALRNVYVTTEIFTTQPASPAAGARYHPLTPSRIFDTRSGAPLGPGATMDVQVTGRGGVPATGVSAVVVNVAVTAPTAPSYLTVFPAGEPMPLAANLNFVAGQTVPNLVTAKLGTAGRLSVYNAAGTTQVIGDVAGWYDDGSTASGARYHAVTPSRILDTRTAGAPLGGPASTTLQVTGQGGIPASGVSAVAMNVTVTAPTAISYLTVFPSGEPMPLASNLNFVPAQTVPNLVTAKLGADGKVSIFNIAGSVHVVVDVAGWFDDGTTATGGLFHPLTPSRILDTRNGGGPVGATALDMQVTGRGGVPATGVTAAVVNVTVTAPTAPSFLTVYPTGEPRPLAANLNFLPGDTVPNLVMAKLGTGGRASVYNAGGTVHVIADVAGWFDGG